MPPILPASPRGGRHRRAARRASALLVLAGLSALAAAAPASAASTCAAQGLAVTPLQSPVFYIDISSSYLSSYVGYRVTNTGATTRTGLWERLESFTGGVVAPAGGGAATHAVSVDALAPGTATPTYAYLKAPAETMTLQQHDVVLYDSAPGAGGTEVCRETQTITRVLKVIDAAANKVTGASLSTTSATLGGGFDLTVNGQTGTVGAGIAEDPGVIRFSPAVAADWPSSAFRLVGVTHRLPLAAAPIDDVLSRSNMSGSNTYTVTYRFRVVGPTTAKTPVLPISNIASGTQVKHTDPGSLSSLAPIPKVTSSATMHASVVGTTTAAGKVAPGADVPLTATLRNDGDGPLTVDEIVLRIPATWTAVSGSAERDGASLPDPYDTGSGELRLVGPFTVAAHAESSFAVTVAAGDPGSHGSFSTVATLAGGQIDATTDPSDDTPAAVPLAVFAAPVAHDDQLDAVAGGTTTLDVLDNDDLDGAEGTIAIADPPSTGTAAIAGGQLTYRPDDGQRAPDALTYRVTTAAGTATARVALTIIDAPPAPQPVHLDAHGASAERQAVTAAVPAGGWLTLVDGGVDVASLEIDGEGTYAIDGDDVTFTPADGFAGAATTVTYRVHDSFGQHGDATVTAHVAPPALAAPPVLTSGGVGTAPQTVTIATPAGGSAHLLDAGGHEVAAVTVAGQGTYVLDPATGAVTFTPVLGFAGTPDPVGYRIADAYGQHRDATYAPAVTAPAPPLAAPVSSSGTGDAPQHHTVPVPAGGTAMLLSAGGTQVTSVTVTGVGTYTIDPVGGRITFAPAAGFSGAAPAVDYVVVDAYGQATPATYTPTVVPASDALTGPPAVVPPIPPMPPVAPAAPGTTPAAPAEPEPATQAPATGPAPAPLAALPAPCVSRRIMTVHFTVPRGARIRSVRITINGKVVAQLHGRARQARVDLRGRPKQLVGVVISARLAHGGVLRGTRTYRTCAARRPGTLATLVLQRAASRR